MQQFISIISALLPQNSDDIIHRYIIGLKFFIQWEIRKDLARGMVPSLEVAIALAEQYDALPYNNSNNNSND